MNDEVHRSDELVSSRAIIERGRVVRVIEAQLGPQRNDFVRPPRHAYRMLRIFRCVAGAAADDVIVKFIAQSEETRSARFGTSCN